MKVNCAGLVLCILTVSVASHAQHFVKITDPGNPVVADAGAPAGSYAGASWVDYDGDGFLDLFVNRNSTLYHNIGGGNFERFLNAIPNQGNTFGNTWADMDNDGDPDCFVAGGTLRGSFLYRNDGAQFTKITSGAIGDTIANAGWGCAWGDYDQDGYVDLVIAAPFGFAGISHENRFFHNNGNGTLSRVDTSVIAEGTAPYTVPTWADYDQDSDLDLFIGSGPATGMLAPDYLYRNTLVQSGNPVFERITTPPIATDLVDGQVWNWIDYDNDGDLDAFLTNYNASTPNNLYRNNAGTFERMTQGQVGTIVSDASLSLANVWGDFDNDGDLDCFVTNDSSPRCWYYANTNDGAFERIDSLSIVSFAGPHYGATAGDYDNDGDLDLFVSGTTSTKGLYRNDLPGTNHWVKIRCVGAGGTGGSNISALGTVARARATVNGVAVWQMREVSAQNSFNSQNMLDLHFGLGDATVIDSLVLSWTSGLTEIVTGVSVDQQYTAMEGNGIAVAVDEIQPALPSSSYLHPNFPNPFNPSTTIRFEVRERGKVSLRVFDLLGRELSVLVDQVLEPGAYAREFDAGDDTSSGVYFYRLETGGSAQIRRMVLLK